MIKATGKELNKKRMKGTVVSDKMDKTVVVVVNRYVKHPKYKKFLNLSKKFKAHDEKNEYKIGDEVIIEECRPLSKDKHFIVSELVTAGDRNSKVEDIA